MEHTSTVVAPKHEPQIYKGKGLASILLSCFSMALLFGFNFTAAAQIVPQVGYIYIHKKALDESISPNFTFNITGGSTVVAPISLNDQTNTFYNIQGLGGDAGGGLWALSGEYPADANGNYPVYYRARNSSTWVLKTGTRTDIDGGANGTSISTNAAGQVFYDDGTTVTNVTGNLPAAAVDVSDNWLGTQYAVLSNDQIWRRTTASTTWTRITGIGGKNVDAVPNTNQIVYVGSDQATILRINNDGTGQANLGVAEDPTFEVAVTGNGTIYARNNDNLYQRTGTTWVKETKTQQLQNITGGPATQLWANVTKTGTSAGNRIYSRAQTGDFISDENVRVSPNDNASLIAVAPGTYTITESATTGWNLNSITLYETVSPSSSDIPSRSATLIVSGGEVVHVVFENQFVQSTTIVNNCDEASTFKETFGQGTGYGGPLTGLTSYHFATSDFGYGFYSLIRNSNMMNSYVDSFTDHTGDANGRMLAVDGTIEQGVFYRRRFTGLVPGSKYNFSAWIMNLNPGAPDVPNVSFNVYNPVDGSLISSTNSGNVTTVGVWQQATLVFTATETTLDLELMNNTLGTSGNDLAIDDIAFGVAIPQPVTIQTNANCTQGGSITVTSPLSSGYEYSIDGITYQTSPVFTNLAAGSYSVTARYISGTCTSPTTPVAITQTCPPTANDDNSSGNTAGSNVIINILTNDLTASGNPATPGNTTVTFNTTGLPAGSTISGNTITVPGEGVYSYDPATGNLTFDPAPTFLGNPTPLNYTLTEIATGLTDPAVVKISYGSLPVKLVSFTASKYETSISLDWSTTEEVNSENFEIERSRDAKRWALIGSVSATGESKSTVTYNFLDAEPINGINYYRLKMIDKDQTFAYSRIQNVNFETGSELLVTYPNPVSNELFFKNMKESVKEIEIININGQVVYHMGGSNKVVNDVKLSNNGLDISKLTNGIYLVRITKANGALDTHKIVISR